MDANVIVLILTGLLLVVSYCDNWQARWKFRHMSGPRPSPLLGNLKEIRRKQLFVAQKDWAAQYGGVYRFFFLRKPVVCITDPKLVNQVTVKQFTDFRDRFIPSMDNPLLSGKAREGAQSYMITARGPLWGSLRAGAQPMFHSANLATYAATINNAVDVLIDRLSKAADTHEEVNIFQQLGQMTMQVIGVAAFGIEVDRQHDQDNMLIDAAKTVFANSSPSLWVLAAMSLPAPLLPFIKALARAFPGEALAAMLPAYDTLYDISASLIQNTKTKLGMRAGSTDWLWFERRPNNPYKRTTPSDNSLIPMLLKANNKATGQPLSDLQIAAQSNLFMLAGYETTALALSYSIYLVAQHPQVQQKLLQEVDAAPGRPTYEQLERYPYAAAVISEALRVLPPASIIGRKAMQDVQVGPYQIPKDTPVHISIFAMHHDERWWQDADSFKPERWLGDKTGGDRSRGLAYLPFGAGPRNCIGYKLALEEAIISLVRLYQHFTFQLASSCPQPLDLKQGITMSPKGQRIPVHVSVRA